MRRIGERPGGVNSTLKELILGTVLWSAILGLALVWFAGSAAAFLFSLAAGMLTGVGMAVHMCRTIEESLDLPQKEAAKHMRVGTLLRMAAVLAVFFLVWRLHGSVPGAFLGVFSLKLGAYTQPLLHKLGRK